MQNYDMGWSKSLKIARAVCNGLVMKGKTSVIGDALEKQLFKAVEAQYVVSITARTRPCRFSQGVNSVAILNLERFELWSDYQGCWGCLQWPGHEGQDICH